MVDWKEANTACESMSPEEDLLVRAVVSHIAEKWTMWTMAVLAEAGRPIRFTRILEQVENVSQKSLTNTLRQLERNRLVTRCVFPEVPPRVEYAITPLGLEMLDHLYPVWLWAVRNRERFGLAATTPQAHDA